MNGSAQDSPPQETPPNTTLALSIVFCLAELPAFGQAPLTLRQAIDLALGQSPQAAIARGDDQVYAFGTRLRQRQFTQADFALNALNRSQAIGNSLSRFSGG